MTTDELKALLDKARETFCLASPGSDEEFAAYLCGFDAASQIALSHCDALREQMAGARVKFDWTSDRVNGHPSEAKTVWRCRVGGAVIGVVEEYDEGDVWVDDPSDGFEQVYSDIDVMAEARRIVERRILSAIEPPSPRYGR